MVMDIHLDEGKLHEDLQAVREVRSRLGAKEEIDIRLIWEKGNETHMVHVFAEGPNLWVMGYYKKNNAKTTFDKPGKKSILNYHDNDVGCPLTLPAIKSTLEKMEADPDDFQPVKNSEVRKAYVMCVFMASEIVRNELLEKILLKQTREENPSKKWSDYLLLYTAWSRASEILYDVGCDDFHPSIAAARVRDHFNLLENSSLGSDEIEKYRNIRDELLEAGLL